MKAYKYFDSSLQTRILVDGSFRIGTLYDYRKDEAHGSQIGDPKEGKIGAHSQVLSWTSTNPYLRNEHAASFVRGNAVVFGEGSSIGFGPGGAIGFGPNGVSFANVTLRSELQVRDLFVFSLSLEPSAENMKKMGYDACYEVTDVEAFAKAMVSPSLGGLAGFGSVIYQPKEMHYEIAKNLNPALIKEPKFSYQKEVRILWQPPTYPISPTFVVSPEATRFCKIFSL